MKGGLILKTSFTLANLLVTLRKCFPGRYGMGCLAFLACIKLATRTDVAMVTGNIIPACHVTSRLLVIICESVECDLYLPLIHQICAERGENIINAPC